MVSTESIQRRSIMLIKLLWGYTLFSLIVNFVFNPQMSLARCYPDAIGLVLSSVIYLLVRRRLISSAAMYFMVALIFFYCYLLMGMHPCLANMVMMWICVPFVTIYQDAAALIMAGVLNGSLTMYFWVSMHAVIFPGVSPLELMFLQLGNIFLVIFFLYSSSVNRKLQQDAEANERKLNRILKSTGIVSWSYDVKTDRMSTSDNVKQLTGYEAQQFSINAGFYRKIIHPEDRDAVEAIRMELLAGKALNCEYRIITPAGGIVWAENRAVPIMDRHGNVEVFEGFWLDCTDKKQKEEKVNRLAYFDALTGLPNLTNFRNQAEEFLTEGSEYKEAFALLVIDLDEFKQVNDMFGHDAGNKVLCHVAQRLRSSIRDHDLVCRMFGDEFMVLFPGANRQLAQELSDRIRKVIEEPYAITGATAKITCSIGISLYPEHGREIAELINRADNAMYGVKAGGKNDCGVFGGTVA